MLAVKSGTMAANALLVADRAGRSLTRNEQARYTRRVGKMCTVFLNMIKMFYDNHSFEVFMAPKPPRDMEWAVNSGRGQYQSGLEIAYQCLVVLSRVRPATAF